jgi:hypothetical protein
MLRDATSRAIASGSSSARLLVQMMTLSGPGSILRTRRGACGDRIVGASPVCELALGVALSHRKLERRLLPDLALRGQAVIGQHADRALMVRTQRPEAPVLTDAKAVSAVDGGAGERRTAVDRGEQRLEWAGSGSVSGPRVTRTGPLVASIARR